MLQQDICIYIVVIFEFVYLGKKCEESDTPLVDPDSYTGQAAAV